MKTRLFGKWLVLGMVTGVTSVLAQTAPTGGESTTEQKVPGIAAEKTKAKPVAADPAAKTTAPSPVVEEVLKMVQGGVSKDVVKTYIDTAPISAHLSAVDIIALKEHAVPDELAVALVKRGAEVPAQAPAVVAPASAASATVPVPLASPAAPSAPALMDPEGYDYFWYYYLYPRTLASANQRLYSAPYTGFGYYPPGAFRHHNYRTHFRSP